MKILNLTQHPATAEQIAAGVVDLVGESLSELKRLLTFDTIPTKEQIQRRAASIARLAAEQNYEVCDEDFETPKFTHAMVGGAPFLMSSLESALMDEFLTPLYAFSVRESVEEVQPDGSVRKINVFRHKGFVGDLP